jgi:flap endonuclease-1
MGIHNLNKLLLDKCKKTNIRKTHLSELSGKTIAIDTSIYLYKFMADNTLTEHFYLMISLFRNYNIVPIFVFDGKPPKAKRELLLKRRQHRKESEEQYNKLKEEYDAMNDSADEKVELRKELDLLKRESTSISYDNLATTKALISAYGAKYEQAEGEADVLCVQLVKLGKAWGCMSDDMDMFVYGCPRVFRHFSLVNHNVISYDFSAMLGDLEMDIQTFREITVLSGTDYNCDNKTSLGETFALYERYKKAEAADGPMNSFYDWVLHNSNYISDIEILQSIAKMFDVANYQDNLAILDNIDRVTFEEIDTPALHAILEKDGFVFVK